MLISQQTLREAITAGLDDEEVWRLLGQILQALAHMSAMGIVHRGEQLVRSQRRILTRADLKPSNILLGQ
jgi:translation initiation factor 2-alpha kinase 4